MNTLTELEGRAVHWLGQDYRRRVEQAAVRRAYASFAQQYRRWANSLFDWYFLSTVPAEILEQGDAPRLARAWAAQLTYGNPARRQQHEAMILPVATAFLQLLAKERGLSMPNRQRGRLA